MALRKNLIQVDELTSRNKVELAIICRILYAIIIRSIFSGFLCSMNFLPFRTMYKYVATKIIIGNGLAINGR